MLKSNRFAWILFASLLLTFVPSLLAQTPTYSLSFRPVDAGFSAILQRIVIISANPDQLHIYDPVANIDSPINLPATPLGLSISPDGLHAAVAHNGLVSYVDLQAASVAQVFHVSENESRVVAAEKYIYLLPSYEGDIASINISTGQVTTKSFFYGSGGSLDPAGDAIYGTEDGLSPNSLQKYSLSGGVITTQVKVGPYWGDYPICGHIWFSPGGNRIYNGCGTVYRSSGDPTQDGLYVTTLEGVNGVQSLASTAATNRVAAIPSSSNYFASPQSDGEVRLFESNYLRQVGRFGFSNFVAGGNSYAAHGRWVFFNASGSALFAVVQADSTSGLQNDYALQTIDLTQSNPCQVSLSASSVSVPAAGSLGTVNITAGTDCTFSAVSNDPWIQIVSGGYGSGNSALSYIIRPNLTSEPRAGSLTIDDATLTVSQDAASATSSSFNPLSFKVTAADFSKALGKMVLASSSPNELHIYDPDSHADQIVPLLASPLSVSVRPDGLYAAVGHDGWISYVNLQTGSVEKIFTVYTDVHGIVLAGNGYIYAFPQRDWSAIYSLEISTGVQTAVNAIYDGRVPRLHASDKYLYVGGSWWSKWDITQGIPTLVKSPVGLSYGSCGNLWLTEDGNRIFTGCGAVLRSSEVSADDFAYNGSLANVPGVTWAANSLTQRSTAVIPSHDAQQHLLDTEVQLYGDDYLGLAAQMNLPSFSVGGSSYPSHGRYLFWNSAETALFVVVQADSTAGLTSDYAIDTVGPSNNSNSCTISLGSSSVQVLPQGGFQSVSVASADGCSWTAQTGVPWIIVTAGAFGFGSGTINFTVLPNGTGVTRSATLTVGGQTFSVTQTSSPAGWQANPTQLAFGTADVGSASASVSVSISNPGTSALTFQSLQLSGANPRDFSIQANTCGSSLAAGSSCNLSIAFTPQGAGSRSASLVAADNAANSPQVLNLTGTAQMPPAPALASLSVGIDGELWGIGSADDVYRFNYGLQVWQKQPVSLSTIAVGSCDYVWGLDHGGSIFRYNSATLVWDRIPGSLVQIAVGSDGDVWGINGGGFIYHFNGATQNWDNVPGLLTQVAVGFDGAVWGLNSEGHIYRFNVGVQGFEQVPGVLSQIAVGADGDVWGLNSAQQIWHFNPLIQNWEQIAGSLSQISVGSAASVWGLSSSGNVYSFDTQAQSWMQVAGTVKQIAAGANGAAWGTGSAGDVYTLMQPIRPTQTWHAVPGLLSHLAVACDGNIWGLNSENQIWHFNPLAQNWERAPGLLSQIGVGFGGNVWGVNSGGLIYRYDTRIQTWENIPGRLNQIAIGANGDVWGINSAGSVYRFNRAGQTWQQVPGVLKQLSVGADGVVWGINAAGQIWRYNPQIQSWDAIPGILSQIAVGSAKDVWGVNTAGEIYRFNTQTQTWDTIPGRLSQIAVGFDGTVYGTNSWNDIYRFSTQAQTWQYMLGSSAEIAVGAAGAVWQTSSAQVISRFW